MRHGIVYGERRVKERERLIVWKRGRERDTDFRFAESFWKASYECFDCNFLAVIYISELFCSLARG